jgi:transcriptional regulator with XRE-family HTH domain
VKESAVGTILKKAREEKGMSMRDVALKVGVSKSIYGFWEVGHKGIHWSHYKKLCPVLSVDVHRLMAAETSDYWRRKIKEVYSG